MLSLIAVILIVMGFYVVRKLRVAPDDNLSSAAVQDAMTKQKNLQLIDVRTHAEFASGYLAGAKNIPIQELSGHLSEIDKQKPVIVYCRSGHRSGLALKILHDHGIPQAKHLQGGILDWEEAGLPVTR
ncbi:MAG: rhodanese-like domain-containing protein [candidate division FCPU426 bacterium]